MSIFPKFNLFSRKEAVPLSVTVNNGLAYSLISKNDAMDFYTSWVYACIERRANSLAAIEFKLYRLKKNGEVEEVLEHELLDLLYRINPDMTKYDFMHLSITYLDMFGASPWVLDGGKGGAQPKNIYLARPEYMKVKRDSNGAITGYEYQTGNKKTLFDKDEVVFLKNYNPKDPNRGLGVIEAVRLTAQTDDYIQQHNSKLLENGARPSGFFKIDGNVNSSEIKRLSKEVKSEYGGFQEAGKVGLLQGGMTFEAAQLSPKDLDFLESRKMNRDEIMTVFGVSKPIMGIYEDINRASAQTAEYLFAKYTLEPLARKYFEQINEYITPRYGTDLWLDFEDLAQEDEEVETNKRDKSWNRWKTTNEVRAEDGLEPVSGGDIIYMPLSSMPTMRNDNTPGKKEIIQLEAKTGQRVDLKTQHYVKKRILNRNVRLKRMAERAAEKAFDRVIEKKQVVFRIVPEKKAFELSDDQIDAFYKRRMEEEGSLETLWTKRFAEFFTAQKERFLQKLEDNIGNIKGIAEDLQIDTEQELKATIEIISPLMYETMAKASINAAELVNERTIIDMDFIKTWIDGVSKKTGESITDTTIEAFAKTLKEGIDAGEGLGELKNRVEEVFTFATDYRALLIARTETARGVTEAHRKTYEHYGFTDVKWLLAPGSCELCAEKADASWTVKSIESEIPVHPNCKCDMSPI